MARFALTMRPATAKQLALGASYPKTLLNDDFVAVAPPDSRLIRDAKVNRLVFRAGPRKRVWLIDRAIKIGEWPAMTTDQARLRALEMIGTRL